MLAFVAKWFVPLSRTAIQCMVVPTEERKRVTTLFKQFCDPGSSKVPLSLMPKVVKEVLHSTHAPDGAYKKIQGLAKEVLPTKSGSSGAVTLGDFISWYFDYAWPELTGGEGVKPPDRKSKAGSASRSAAADAGVSRAPADVARGEAASSAAGPTADAGESGAPACAPTAAAMSSEQVVCT